MVESLTDSIYAKTKDLINRIEQMGGMTKAIVRGLPKALIEETATKRQSRIDSGEEVIVGVNKYTAKDEVDKEVDVLRIDNRKVLHSQIQRLAKVKKERDSGRMQEAIEQLETAANDKSCNLLEMAIHAAKARATVGEITAALEKSWGRYAPKSSVIRGVYTKNHGNPNDVERVIRKCKDFEKKHGRRPRLLVAKIGQDGHDRGAKVIASSFSDFGFDVDIGPLFATPNEVVQQAIDSDVHVVGISTLAAGHRTLVPQVIRLLRGTGIMVVCGGVIPREDYALLEKEGVKAIFGPGTNITAAAQSMVDLIENEYYK